MKESEGFPQEEIVKNLKDFQEHLGAESEMLITYDANTDGVNAAAAYDNPHWSNHATGLMYDVQRELQTGGDFDPAAWSHQTRWDDAVHVVHQCVAATRVQTLEMGDRVYHLRRGERFVAVNNFKFSEPVFQELCERAGLDVKASAEHRSLRLQHLMV